MNHETHEVAAEHEVTAYPEPASREAESRATQQAEQLAAAEDRWKRAVADLDNHRKRMVREVETVREQERQRAARALLPVVDGLERALQFGTAADEGLLGGIAGVRRQAVGALADLGYPRIEAEGTPFDPRLHEVVSVTDDPKVPPRTVVAVVRAGFGVPDRMLRPAGVVVTREEEKE